MKNLTGKQILFIITAFFVGLYAYYVPIQRIKAEKAVNRYIELQGADIDKIESRRVLKDWTQNGHYVHIVFEDNPGIRYDYHYKKDGYILLLIRTSTGGIVYNIKDIKYPRIYEGNVLV